jgi:succinate dehydrogenase / fumarate reductase iron-sulfur subunit
MNERADSRAPKEAPKEVVYRVRRFRPEEERRPVWQTYRIAWTHGMTVLDGLWQIKETVDPTVAFRASCRMGVCGSCGMLVNGQPRLACNTQVAELGGGTVTVAPLPNFDIVRDLVPDLGSMFDHHTALKPYLIREDGRAAEQPGGELKQTQHELEEYLQFSYCIKCGCCMAACPTLATDVLFSGPMPLSQAHRYNADSRDGGFAERKQVLAGSQGPWRCHYAGECARVCPKGVDPAKAIQWMKRELMLDLLGLRTRRAVAGLVTDPPGAKPRPGIPPAPPRTVGA